MTNTNVINKYASVIKTKKLIKQAQAAEITIGSIVGLLALLAAGGYGIHKYYRSEVDAAKKKHGWKGIAGGATLGVGAGTAGNWGASKYLQSLDGKNPNKLLLGKLFTEADPTGSSAVVRNWAKPFLLDKHLPTNVAPGKWKSISRTAIPVLGALGLGAIGKATSDSIVEHEAAKEHPFMSSVSEFFEGL